MLEPKGLKPLVLSWGPREELQVIADLPEEGRVLFPAFAESLFGTRSTLFSPGTLALEKYFCAETASHFFFNTHMVFFLNTGLACRKPDVLKHISVAPRLQ